MKTIASPNFIRRLKKIVKKNSSLAKKFDKQIALFCNNINHPSLKTHKLQGERSEQYAFWIEGDLRIVFIWSGPDVIFTEILTHDKY
jgi:mRNA-degrading endonuclease YafQ of YafQ-DinJ toxin-antitoxin module